MSAPPRSYQTLAEFEREEIRPSFRIGFSIDDLEESAFEGELNFEATEREELESEPIEELDEDDEIEEA